jgi:hypothetical protein
MEERELNSPDESRALITFREYLREREQVPVAVTIEATIEAGSERHRTANVCIDRVDVDGRTWLEKERIHWLDEMAGSRLPEVSPVIGGLYDALTTGFARLDCPRSLPRWQDLKRPKPEDEEAFIAPVELRQPALGAASVLNDVYQAEHRPEMAARWREMVELLRIKWGQPVTQVYRTTKDSPERIELLLADLVDFRDKPGALSIPAANQGTGFVQSLYVLLSHVLFEASSLGIEELEANLDPSVQADVWRTLGEDIRYGKHGLRQVIVTSHSPSFLLSHSPRVQEDVDVWFAERDEQGRAQLRRLNGKGDTRDKLYRHFTDLDIPSWRRLSAADWTADGAKEAADIGRALYRGSDLIWNGPGTKSPTKKALAKKIDEDVRLVVAAEVQGGKDVPLERALALDEWLVPDKQPLGMLRVEWEEPSPLDGGFLWFRVETGKSSQQEDQKLLLWVEESLPAAVFQERADVIEFVKERFEFLERRASTIQSRLQRGQ